MADKPKKTKETLSQPQKAFVQRHMEKVRAIAREQGTVVTKKGQKAARAAVERTLLAQNKRRGK